MKQFESMDGNKAAAYASYALTEVASIFPITPSTPMAEGVDEWSAHGKKNIFNQAVKVIEMQSEAGAVGTMRGALQAGSLASTYTASQGLLLMIPNLYKMAGELLPGVLHVAARSIATHALSIYGDHQDVMACRQTGASLLASSNVQEVMDLGVIAHLAAIKSRLPFIHFFDGFRTSHEIQKIEKIDYEDIKALVDYKSLEDFKNRALNPEHPVTRGTAQNPDIYFQQRESQNQYFMEVPDIVQHYMDKLGEITGRKYKLFDYYGDKEAEYIIVAMGSVTDTIRETIDYLRTKGEKVGVVKVHLYRPFSEKYLLEAIPSSVKKIAVLDRTKEPGSTGEPLYLDIVKCYKNYENPPLIVGGRYGLSSKDTRPSQIISVYENLKKSEPKDNFTIGIVDDVSNTSLPEGDIIETAPEGTIRCRIWGLGSDGTVGANKTAIKIIGDNTNMYVQGYFSYDSKKSGGTTTSHLRFGKEPIRSPYLVFNADYIACHNKSFIYHYDIIKGLKHGGTFVLNCSWSTKELDEKIPASIKNYIAKNNINFYIIDAMSISSKVGLGNRINMVMQSVFFKLANVLPVDEALNYLKQNIEEMYGRKGSDIVEMNKKAVDKSIEALIKVDVPSSWANAKDDSLPIKDEPDFVKNIQRPMARDEGDELPVSTFKGMEDGTFPNGTTSYEKRGIAPMIPEWQIDKCIQCGRCSYVCPHATIRPFLLDNDEEKRKPDTFKTTKPIGKNMENYHWRIQVSPMDCTGCANCADICPAKGKALIMKPAEHEIEMESENWEFAMTVKPKEDVMDKFTVKGSQFLRPLMEFSGACPGCGETPYIRLITQLFGDRMMISNATGCSSIYGASAPSMPYSTNAEGRGPAWINPLFEDAAEFGLGLQIGVKQNREKLLLLMKESIKSNIDDNLKSAFSNWIDNFNDGEGSKKATNMILNAIKDNSNSDNLIVQEILKRKDQLIKKSVWSFGGDGWAYDIGYGGLDHVIASGEDINILVMDTEVYSNTGGQCSKSTPAAAVAKFAAGGKKIRKKDLGLIAMTYGYVYVTQIAMGADMNQTIKAIKEAENYKGPSLIIAYSPCINHGIKSGMGTSMMEEKKAVDSGYWHLYRFNPELKEQGKNPFILDSKEPSQDYIEFIRGEIRYSQLMNVFPEIADEMYNISSEHASDRYRRYKALADHEVF
ncbi:pyruvate:ferredoxin (flavodoxin) oxidoreductase [Sedimentibacter sp. MB31-C6]|uniref:pyruvate:ferredoxin (flavodoxin) oxidoreductase n=1 Tax=Sedimentibacter sp. MB31-C6 TaxID=3109366 RepID=UPI002DDD8457|nr:pyruvate:ferredoxin (flavodoxin) oxidoreductase [Sedimentibacter sp. MB36-C1]WSI04114.1 pyruvate:ferredoxin (flavodoxin) oxidoreductase [Sedimentibacter sp. MB36-C1]